MKYIIALDQGTTSHGLFCSIRTANQPPRRSRNSIKSTSTQVGSGTMLTKFGRRSFQC